MSKLYFVATLLVSIVFIQVFWDNRYYLSSGGVIVSLVTLGLLLALGVFPLVRKRFRNSATKTSAGIQITGVAIYCFGIVLRIVGNLSVVQPFLEESSALGGLFLIAITFLILAPNALGIIGLILSITGTIKGFKNQNPSA